MREKLYEAHRSLENVGSLHININDVKEKQRRATRLANRIEARVRKRKNEGNDIIKTDQSLLDGIHKKGKLIDYNAENTFGVAFM